MKQRTDASARAFFRRNWIAKKIIYIYNRKINFRRCCVRPAKVNVKCFGHRSSSSFTVVSSLYSACRRRRTTSQHRSILSFHIKLLSAKPTIRPSMFEAEFDIVICRSSFARTTHRFHRFGIHLDYGTANKQKLLSNTLHWREKIMQPNSTRIFIRFRSMPRGRSSDRASVFRFFFFVLRCCCYNYGHVRNFSINY